jgi:DinB superfamily
MSASIRERNFIMARPDSTEYAPYYEKYLVHVPEDDIVPAMKAGMTSTLVYLSGIPESETVICHPPYTWTIKQVIGHLIDCERIFGYRALRIARGDSTPLPGFDENAYAEAAQHNRVSLPVLISEFGNVRSSHTAFFEHLPEEAWARRGTANNNEVSVRAIAFILLAHERYHLEIIRKRLSAR